MSHSPWRTLSALAAVLAAFTSAAVPQKPPKRPVLPAGADTNDAMAYHAYGIEKLRDKPGNAFLSEWL